jgi:hypothetical protein
MRSMFASKRGSISAPVIKHGKSVLSFYSILIKVRESSNDSTLAGG